MGARLVVQPNGRLAWFSEIVDDFTHTNLTEKEALDLCGEKGLSGTEAHRKVFDARHEIDHNGAPRSYLYRWKEAREIQRAARRSGG